MNKKDELMEKMDIIKTCFVAVSELLIPGDDLVLNRDNLATLMMFLSEQQVDTLRKLSDLN